MKILIDHQAFSMQKYGGISRIFAELIKGFEDKKLEINTPFFYTENEYYRTLFPTKLKNTWIDKIHFPQKSKVLQKLLPIINNLYTIFFSNKKQNVYFPTYYNPYLIDKITSAKKVLFVYDMIHELYPEMFKVGDTTSANKLRMMEMADIILPISHNTQKDIIRLYPHLANKKFEVVHLSHSIIKEENLKIKNTLPKEYILFVGSRNKYKNFDTLLDAFAILNSKKYSLICVGGGSFSQDEIEKMRKFEVVDRIIQMNLFDIDLYTIYKNASVFIFPSLYEGFGIPVLEAMYSSCPVILGKYSSFPEIAEEAGIYCDVTDSKELAKTIDMVLTNDDFRLKKIEEGLAQVEKFSWQKSIDNTAIVLSQL
jgi:glycosyltransferase involved in cell wall biosynthesis